MQNISEEIKYKQFQAEKYHEFEAACKRCGACCGVVEGDPCEHLVKLRNGRYFCDTYEDRLGVHRTISGAMVRCVSVREIINKDWPGIWQCAYNLQSREVL